MSFLVACELSGLAALYDTKTHSLIITAKGEAPGWYLGPFIEPETLVGGLKFSLRAFAGGLGPHPEMKPFDVTYKMPIILPNPVITGKEVIIATANNPHGFVVPIRYTGLNGDGSTSAHKPEAADATNIFIVLKPITIYVPGEGYPFQLSAADAGPHGSVRLSYNKAAIKMDEAGIEGKNITWVFEATKLGETLVEVTTIVFAEAHPSWAPLTKIQPYLVRVVLTKEDSS